MQNITNQITPIDIKKFFKKSLDTENIHLLFSSGFPSTLLESDHFIDLLKRRALWDEAGACIIIDYAKKHLPVIIYDNRVFSLFYKALSQNILSYLFTNADFIPHRFFNNFANTKTWLLDNSISIDHRLFLFKYYQQHFIQLLKSQPFTLGILSILLCFLRDTDKKDTAFTQEIMLAIKPKIIYLLQEENILPSLRYFLLNNTNSEEFTLLIREIPESITLLCEIENPKFFPLIQFEKLSLGSSATIQLQFIQNLTHYYDQQKGCPAFFTATVHFEDTHFISEIKKLINESEKNSVEKIIKIKNIIVEKQEVLSSYIKKLLTDRQLNKNTPIILAQGEKELSPSSSF